MKKCGGQKTFKKWIVSVLCAALMLETTGMDVLAEEIASSAPEEVAGIVSEEAVLFGADEERQTTGEGDDVKEKDRFGTDRGMNWSISEDGKLTISGEFTANMDEWDGERYPAWHEFAGEIRSVKVTATGVRSTEKWFEDCENLESVDFSEFNTENVYSMWCMFKGCHSLAELNLSGFNTAKVESMAEMFMECKALKTLDLSSFDSESLEDMNGMFGDCESLSELKFGAKFTAKKVKYMEWAFGGTGLTELDLSTMELDSLEETGNMLDIWNLQTVKAPKNLKADIKLNFYMSDSEGTEYRYLPKGLSESVELHRIAKGSDRGVLFSVDENGLLTIFGNYHDEDYGEDEWWPNWLYYSDDVTSVKVTATNVPDIGHWFNELWRLEQADLSEFDTSKITDMSAMFKDCENLREIRFGEAFTTANVENMELMFHRCRSLTSLDLSTFDTSKVTSMWRMFQECENLESITYDINKFKTGNVEGMSNMFRGCGKLESIDVSGFDTSKVKDMGLMFAFCTNLKELNVSSFNTANNENFDRMFADCSRLTNLDVSRFDTGKATNVQMMFNGCSNLQSLDMSNMDFGQFDPEEMNDMQIGRMYSMFEGCNSLKELKTPKNVKADVALRVPLKDGDGNCYVSLPTGRSESVALRYVGGLNIMPVPDQEYTGKAIVPPVVVTSDENILSAGLDYTLSYKNNVDAGEKTAEVIVKGKGNYSGTQTAKFTIKPRRILTDNTSVADLLYTENGSVRKPVPVVTVDGNKLKVGKDFTVGYPDEGKDGAYTAPGEWDVVIHGTGNYADADENGLHTKIVILKKDQIMASSLKISGLSASYDYTGKEIVPEVTVSVKGAKENLVKDRDYTVYCYDNLYPGKATLVVVGTGNVTDGAVCVCGATTKTFTIKGMALSKAKLTYDGGAKTYTANYTGEEIRPEPTLTAKVGGKDVSLKQGEDYEITYQNNVNAGKATMMLVGINGYTGTVKKNFTIKPAPLDPEDDKWDIEVGDDFVAPYEQAGAKPPVWVSYDGKELWEGTDYTLTYAKNKAIASATAGKNAPVVTIKGKGNYSFQKSVNFTIEKSYLEENVDVYVPDKFLENKGSLLSKPVVTDGSGKKLKENRDYTVVGYFIGDQPYNGERTIGANEPVESGTWVTVKIKASENSNYQGEIDDIGYFVKKRDIASKKIKLEGTTLEFAGYNTVYTQEMLEGKNQVLKLTDNTDKKNPKVLEYGKDFEIVGYTNNYRKGSATMTIIGVGDTYGGTRNVKISIVAKKLQK